MEMQSKFARDMMAQKLMSDNKDNPFNSRYFQPSDAMAAPQIQGFRNLMSRMETRDKQGTGANLYAGGAIASGFTPGAGVSDVLGYAPDPFNPGQTLPSFSENIDQGRYLDAGLQTVGAGGDVMLAASPFMPLLLAPAAAMKMTSQLGKALRSGSKATKSLDNAGEVAKVVPPTDKADGIFAFHGSGADFNEFSLSKIGTGEGLQVYGNGLYFTDSKDIAKFYKDALSDSMAERRYVFDGTTYERGSPEWKMLSLIKNKSIASAKSLVKILESDLADGKPFVTADSIKRYKNILDKAPKKSDIKMEQGRIYEVNIKTVTDNLLDNDLPLDKQPKSIQEKINSLNLDFIKPNMIGEDIYDLIAVKKFKKGNFDYSDTNFNQFETDDKKVSELLNSVGIKGIKYKAGQLTPGRDTSKATNYVIFDDKIIDIMAKYGIVGAIGVSAMQGASGGTEGDILPPGAI
jgi:hypothetical protein